MTPIHNWDDLVDSSDIFDRVAKATNNPIPDEYGDRPVMDDDNQGLIVFSYTEPLELDDELADIPACVVHDICTKWEYDEDLGYICKDRIYTSETCDC